MQGESHFRVVGVPEDLTVTTGMTIEVLVTEVALMEDGAVEYTMRYEDHYE